jgi:hypothetical protein
MEQETTLKYGGEPNSRHYWPMLAVLGWRRRVRPLDTLHPEEHHGPTKPRGGPTWTCLMTTLNVDVERKCITNRGDISNIDSIVCTADRHIKDIVRLRSDSLPHEPNIHATIC